MLINKLLNIGFLACKSYFFKNYDRNTNEMMYSMTLFQKYFLLKKFWVREKSSIVGERIKKSCTRIGKWLKTVFDSSLYIFSGNQKKKILYVLHIIANLEIATELHARLPKPTEIHVRQVKSRTFNRAS